MIDATDATGLRATRRSCRLLREHFASCESSPTLEPTDDPDVFEAHVSDDRWDGDWIATFSRNGRTFSMDSLRFTYLGCH